MQRYWKRPAFTSMAAFCFALLPLVFGCGGAEPKKPRAARIAPKPKPEPKPAPTLPPGVAPVLPATVVASLEGESAIPFFARRGPETLLMYADKGRWKTRILKLPQTGAPLSPTLPEPVDAGEATGDIHTATVRAAESGFLAAWIEPVEKNFALKMMPLDAAGKALSAPLLILQSADEISWIEILPNAKGALLLWETARDRGVDIDNLVVMNGKTIGIPKPVFRRALQWQVVPSEQGAAFAAVEAPAPAAGDTEEEGDAGQKTGRVLFSLIDTNGNAKPPVVVNAEPSAFADVELAEVGKHYVLAWTDKNKARGLDSQVLLSALSKQGNIVVPAHGASSPLGDQALVALIAPQYAPLGEVSERALFAWEDTMAVPTGGRRIRLSTVGPDALLGPERASMVFASSGPPDFAVYKDGFAALTLSPAQSGQGKNSGNEGEADVLPAFVRFGNDLSILASEPVRAMVFGENAPRPYVPYLVRGLSCFAGECSAFAQDAGTPSTLAQVALPVRESVWKAPALDESKESGPRAKSAKSLFVGDGLSEIAAAPLSSGGTLVSYLTYRLDHPDAEPSGEKEGEALATLGLIPVDAKGEAQNPIVISKRAVSIGGVSMAAAPKAAADKSAEIALAWVAREKKGEAQVFVSKVNEAGEKLAQRKVSVVSRKAKSKGDVPSECSDVAIAYAGADVGDNKDNSKNTKNAKDTKNTAGEGFIVAWADTRDGNAEVYVAKVDRGLNKTIPDRRISTAAGDSAEVQLIVRGKETWLLWSDARQNPEQGQADIYGIRLDTQSLQKIGQELKLFTSAGHSRTPQFFGDAKGMWAAWIEEGAGKNTESKDEAKENKQAGLRIVELDNRGALVGTPHLIQPQNGQPVDSAGLLCEQGTCRAVFSSAVGETPYLYALSWSMGKTPGTPKAIAALSGGATQQDLSPIFANSTGNSLFLIDNSVDGTGRIRQLVVDWR